jgi:hypothetical protein
MPRPNSWATHFEKTLAGIASAFPAGVPEGLDWDKLHAVQNTINAVWTSEAGTWEEFKQAVAGYRMFWWRYKENK